MAKTGIWRTGDPKIPEVDTRDSAQLERWNVRREQDHQRRVQELEEQGMPVASIVYDPRLKPYSIDVTKTDIALSAAINLAAKKL